MSKIKPRISGDGFIISGFGVKYVQVTDGRFVMESDLSLHNYLEEHPTFYYKVINGKAVETSERQCLADYCYIGKKKRA